METWIVYGLRLASIKGYRYVGLSRKGIARLSVHIGLARNPKWAVHKWMAEHEGDIVLQILEVCPVGDLDYLTYAERYWIRELRSFGHDLLNMTDGGQGPRGLKHSEEFRKNQSARVSGSNNPMYGSARVGPTAPRYGAKNSDEHNEKVRQYQLSERNTWRGQKHKPETLQKMSEKRAEYWTPERRAQLAERMRQPKTPEHRKAMSEARMGKPSRGMHNRWHVNRGITNPDCPFC